MFRRLASVAAIVIGAAIVAWLVWGRGDPAPLAGQSGAPSLTSSGVDGAGRDLEAAGTASRGDGDVPEDAATTMTLTGGDITLSYPADFGLAVSQEQLLVDSSVPLCDEGFDYCIYLKSGAYDGTNFDGAALGVTVRDDLDYEAACLLEQPEGYSQLEPVIDGGVGHATSTFPQVGQGAAGHVTNGAIYRLYFEDACYEFESRVAKAQYENFEPGAVERFDDSDLQAVRGQLREIVATVALPDGRDALFSRDTSMETLVEDIQVRGVEPEAGSRVSSPIELSGEALGVWFFEGSFPFRLQTRNGDVLASGAVEADGDWMTTEFVPFSATIEYDVEVEMEAELVLMNDNPSGLPENDVSLTVPLTLLP